MSAWRYGVSIVTLCVLAACATQPGAKAPATHAQTATTPEAAPLDASYDWHSLVLMPFGTLLKESPIALHEVLLFHDDSHANTSELGKDCFTVDGQPPRLVGHEPEEFLLCFSHDRLDRIEASVSMKAGEGPTVLARACALWLKNAATSVGAASCEGRDGDVAFNAHLGHLPGDGGAEAVSGSANAVADASEGGDFLAQPSILSLVLSHTAERGTVSEH
jgi:hypothetical protein